MFVILMIEANDIIYYLCIFLAITILSLGYMMFIKDKREKRVKFNETTQVRVFEKDEQI
tara:strand:- start:101 stop:277 length:177 start_codon:yes stop_codon:yes gene_type:complete